MKFNQGLFLVAFSTSALPFYGALAKSDNCDTGKYLLTHECYWCPSGCYCAGVSNNRLQLDPSNDISKQDVIDWCNRTKDSCDKPSSGKYKDQYESCGRNTKAQVFRCPDDFQESEGSSTTINHCYAKFGSKKLYYQKHTCVAGKYLPINSDECKACETSGDYVCKGVENVYPSLSKNQGLDTCPSGQKPNANRTACESSTSTSQKFDLIQVTPGYFLPSGEKEQVACKGDTKYCPGGYFSVPYNKEQGRYDCPNGSRVNENGTACTMTITKEQMEKGLNKNSQCWTFVDSEDYLNCMGIKIVDVQTYITTPIPHFGTIKPHFVTSDFVTSDEAMNDKAINNKIDGLNSFSVDDINKVSE